MASDSDPYIRKCMPGEKDMLHPLVYKASGLEATRGVWMYKPSGLEAMKGVRMVFKATGLHMKGVGPRPP